MNPRTEGSVRRGTAGDGRPSALACLGASRGSPETSAQTRSQPTPKSPVTRNAPRQPHASAMGVTISGVTIAPSDPPLYARASPLACCSGRSVWDAVRRPAGNVAPSPKPSTNRATANARNPYAKACDTEAAVQRATLRARPSRTPYRSRSRPQNGFPIRYANEKALTIDVYWV